MAKSKKQDNSNDPTPAERPAKKPVRKKAEAESPVTASADAGSPAPGKAKKAPRAKAAAKSAETEAPAAAEAAAQPAAPAKAASPSSKPAKPAPAEKPEAKKSPAPSTTTPAFGGIDTSLAARAAASLVANRDLLGGSSKPAPAVGSGKPDQKIESGAFKNLKQNLQPGGGLNKILGIPSAQKKGGLPFGGGGPGGSKGQSSGGGGNKLGVPRRTSG